MRNISLYQGSSPKFSDSDERPNKYPRFAKDEQIKDPVTCQIMTMLEEMLAQFQDDMAIQMTNELFEAGGNLYLTLSTFIKLQRDHGSNNSIEMHTRAETETLGEVTRFRPEPGEILVFHGINGEELGRIVEKVRKIEDFPKVLFVSLPDGSTLTRETLESLKALLEATT